MSQSRRQFLFAAGALVAAGPGRAQQLQRVRRIGWLSNRKQAYSPFNTIKEALRRIGYEEGRNLVIELRISEGANADSLRALAEQLVGLKVELIVVDSGVSAIAAKSVTQSMPIVLGGVAQPVELGLIASYARPGGNITGFDWSSVDLDGKLYQILKEAVPTAKRATRLIVATKPEVLLVSGADAVSAHFPAIVSFTIRQKLVAISGHGAFSIHGGLLRYSTHSPTAGDRIARYVDQILRGAKPSELPVERPTKFELALNMRTAQAMGVTFPPSFMARVDRVIE